MWNLSLLLIILLLEILNGVRHLIYLLTEIKIITLFGKDVDGDGKEDDLTSSNLFIGEPISAIYGYQIDGIWQLNDEIPTGYHPGNYRIVDTDGKEGITVDDRIILGKKDPAYRFGIMNNSVIKILLSASLLTLYKEVKMDICRLIRVL